MKSNAFGERTRLLTEWFQDWNSCEQTIALYSLLSRVSATQARFLSLVLEHSLKNGCDSQELRRMELQANNPAYLTSLQGLDEGSVLARLLAHLPLLNPGNAEARKEYMHLLPKVLLGSSEELDYLDQCRQLLSLALVHPAFPAEDRDALTYWLSRLNGKQAAAERSPGGGAAPPPIPPRTIRSSHTTNGPPIIPIMNGDLLSLPAHSEGGLEESDEAALDEDEFPFKSDSLPPGKGLFLTGMSAHQLTLPASNGGLEEYVRMNSSSKFATMPVQRGYPAFLGALEEPSQFNWSAGMKDVPSWLKSLRLHKYAFLFSELCYEDMLELPESYLEERGVTKGARNKIILSIRKLAKRPETLTEIEQDMEKPGRLHMCIHDVHRLLHTPIKPYDAEQGEGEGARPRRSRKAKGPVDKPEGGAGSGEEEGGAEESSSGSSCGSPQRNSGSSDAGSDLDELLSRVFPQQDLPSLLTRAMGKAFSRLMLHVDTNEDNLGAFIKLMDTAITHEAFRVEQRKLFFEWRQQCQQTLRVLAPKKPRSRQWAPGCSFTFHGVPTQQSVRSKSRSLRPARNGAPPKLLPTPSSARSSSTLPRMSSRQLQQPLPTHAPSFLRPKSAIFSMAMSAQAKPFIPSGHPAAAFAPPTAPPPLPPKGCDETYMDDLCKRVTEHALDDPNDS